MKRITLFATIMLLFTFGGCSGTTPLFEAHAPAYPVPQAPAIPKVELPSVPGEVFMPFIVIPNTGKVYSPGLRDDAIPWDENHAIERHGEDGKRATEAHRDYRNDCSIFQCKNTPSGTPKLLRSCKLSAGEVAVQWLNVVLTDSGPVLRQGTAFIIRFKESNPRRYIKLIENNGCSFMYGDFTDYLPEEMLP